MKKERDIIADTIYQSGRGSRISGRIRESHTVPTQSVQLDHNMFDNEFVVRKLPNRMVYEYNDRLRRLSIF